MWSTVMELRRPKGFDVAREKLLSVVPDGASVGFGERGEITVEFTNRAQSAADATKISLERFALFMLSAKLTLEPHFIRTQPTNGRSMPRLAGPSEVADILGVTKSRVSQLLRSSRFPVPVAQLAMGPVYLEHEIRKYKSARDESVQRREAAKRRLPGVAIEAQSHTFR
jgi:transcriptional regulator with XRE-family HTH domain